MLGRHTGVYQNMDTGSKGRRLGCVAVDAVQWGQTLGQSLREPQQAGDIYRL